MVNDFLSMVTRVQLNRAIATVVPWTATFRGLGFTPEQKYSFIFQTLQSTGLQSGLYPLTVAKWETLGQCFSSLNPAPMELTGLSAEATFRRSLYHEFFRTFQPTTALEPAGFDAAQRYRFIIHLHRQGMCHLADRRELDSCHTIQQILDVADRFRSQLWRPGFKYRLPAWPILEGMKHVDHP